MLLLFACTSEWSSVTLEAPHVPADAGFEGEALVAAALARLGYTVEPDDIFDAARIDPLLGRGQNAAELRTSLTAMGFAVGDPVADWAALHADLTAGVPSIVFTESPALLLGYSALSDTALVEDPTLGPTELPRERFATGVQRIRLEPRLPLTLPPPRPGVTGADLARAVRRVRPQLPANATLAAVPPFLLIGDEPPDTVAARAAPYDPGETDVSPWLSPAPARGSETPDSPMVFTTPRAALLERTIALFRADYFTTDLPEPWEIWALRDDDSYRRTTRALFGREADTPYGFANGERRALVMNIGLGGGTLVHELAHPYLVADIPWIPTWFNEGFASLFEQVGETDGHLVGYLNWRLPTLQAHIAAGDVPPLEAFMAQDAATFRAERVALNYAMARYLCYYLQERGLLRTFYRELRAHPEDPTGYRTFLRVVGGDADFQRSWEAWITTLVPP